MSIFEKLHSVWKEVSLLSSWIATLIGSFIIPLPSWSLSGDTLSFYSKAFVFLATISAGYLIIYAMRNKNLKRWTILSVTFLIFLIASYITYHNLRESRTLPYQGTDIIIGTKRVNNDPLTKLEKKGTHDLSRENIMLHVQGRSEKIWTGDSIKSSKFLLIGFLVLCYCFTACFVVAFCNLIILNRENYAPNS